MKFYKNHFKIDYDLINIINIKNINFTKFDIFFLSTDDDKIINKINIDLSKVISIDHNSLIRNNIQLKNYDNKFCYIQFCYPFYIYLYI